MSKMLFDNLLQKKDGLIKGPFGGDIKKSLFVPKTDDAYKVYEQGVVLKNDVQFGDYYISKEHFEKSLKRFEVKSGDILMTGAGTLGKLFYVPEIHPKGVINQALLRIRLNESIITPSFFKYYFKYYIEAIISRLNGDSVIPNLPPLPIIKSTEIDIPIISIQKSIAKVLSDLDAKIELNNRINRELEAMAKTLYDYWFVQFDFPDAEGKPYKSSGGKMVYNAELKREIPEGWEVKKLGELVYQVTDSISPDEYPELPYLPIDKLPMKQLYYYEYESRSEANSSLIRFKENDILLGAMRVYFHRVCHAISDGISRSTIIVLRPFKENTKNFALFALNKNEAIEFATNNSTGTSIPYAKWNDSLENYLIGVPKTDYILILFNKIVNPILEKFKVQNKQTQQLTELRDWLLPMLMNGQVTVRQTHGNAVQEAEERLSMAAEPSVEYKKG